jgi:hypothetical protein
MEKEIKINKVYTSIDSKYKIVEKKCDNNTCYHIRLRRRGFLYMWGELPIHYTLEEAKITIPNLIALDSLRIDKVTDKDN